MDELLLYKYRHIISPIILNRLYLSGIEPTYSTILMKPFTHVLSLVNEDFSTVAICNKQKKVMILIDDYFQKLPIDEACDWIAEAHKDPTSNVLVHCHAGISRSPSIITAYLMKSLKLSFTDAYDIVQNAREIVDINPGFKKQLEALSSQLAVIND